MVTILNYVFCFEENLHYVKQNEKSTHAKKRTDYITDRTVDLERELASLQITNSEKKYNGKIITRKDKVEGT